MATKLPTVAKRLAFARSAAGLSGSELARRAGLSRTHVRTIETRGGGLHSRTLERLGCVLGVDTVAWILKGGRAPAIKTIRARIA